MSIRLVWLDDPRDWIKHVVLETTDAVLERARAHCGASFHEQAARDVIAEKLRYAERVGSEVCAWEPREFELPWQATQGASQ